MNKYYVVWVGRDPGIYEDWGAAKAQVHGFKGAKYKSFMGYDKAQEAFDKGPETYMDNYIDEAYLVEDISEEGILYATLHRQDDGVSALILDPSSGQELLCSESYDQQFMHLVKAYGTLCALDLLSETDDYHLVATDSRTVFNWLKRGRVNSSIFYELPVELSERIEKMVERLQPVARQFLRFYVKSSKDVSNEVSSAA